MPLPAGCAHSHPASSRKEKPRHWLTIPPPCVFAVYAPSAEGVASCASGKTRSRKKRPMPNSSKCPACSRKHPSRSNPARSCSCNWQSDCKDLPRSRPADTRSSAGCGRNVERLRLFNRSSRSRSRVPIALTTRKPYCRSQVKPTLYCESMVRGTASAGVGETLLILGRQRPHLSCGEGPTALQRSLRPDLALAQCIAVALIVVRGGAGR